MWLEANLLGLGWGKIIWNIAKYQQFGILVFCSSPWPFTYEATSYRNSWKNWDNLSKIVSAANWHTNAKSKEHYKTKVTSGFLGSHPHMKGKPFDVSRTTLNNKFIFFSPLFSTMVSPAGKLSSFRVRGPAKAHRGGGNKGRRKVLLIHFSHQHFPACPGLWNNNSQVTRLLF